VNSAMIVGFAGSSNTYSPTGYRALIVAGYQDHYPTFNYTVLNIANNGFATWSNLINLAGLATAALIIFDQSNDAEDDTAHVEALIRKARDAGQRVIGIVNPSWTVVEDAQVNTPANQTAIEQHMDLLDAYDVPYVDGWQLCKDHVTGGGHLSDYFSDIAHWSATGQAAVEAAFDDFLPTAGQVGSPARVYAASADFEQAPLVKNGTDYDSKTGVWTETGTRVESSEVGATITFSGTFRSFGCYRSDGLSCPTITVKIDDDDPINNFYFYQNGYDIGTRAAHTIVITVTSTIRIDEFWAI